MSRPSSEVGEELEFIPANHPNATLRHVRMPINRLLKAFSVTADFSQVRDKTFDAEADRHRDIHDIMADTLEPVARDMRKLRSANIAFQTENVTLAEQMAKQQQLTAHLDEVCSSQSATIERLEAEQAEQNANAAILQRNIEEIRALYAASRAQLAAAETADARTQAQYVRQREEMQSQHITAAEQAGHSSQPQGQTRPSAPTGFGYSGQRENPLFSPEPARAASAAPQHSESLARQQRNSQEAYKMMKGMVPPYNKRGAWIEWLAQYKVAMETAPGVAPAQVSVIIRLCMQGEAQLAAQGLSTFASSTDPEELLANLGLLFAPDRSGWSSALASADMAAEPMAVALQQVSKIYSQYRYPQPKTQDEIEALLMRHNIFAVHRASQLLDRLTGMSNKLTAVGLHPGASVWNLSTVGEIARQLDASRDAEAAELYQRGAAMVAKPAAKQQQPQQQPAQPPQQTHTQGHGGRGGAGRFGGNGGRYGSSGKGGGPSQQGYPPGAYPPAQGAYPPGPLAMPAGRPGTPTTQTNLMYPEMMHNMAMMVGHATSPLQAAMQAHLFASPTAFSAAATAAMEQEAQAAQLYDEGHRTAGAAILPQPKRVTFVETPAAPVAAAAAEPPPAAGTTAAPPQVATSTTAMPAQAAPAPAMGRADQQRDQHAKHKGKGGRRRPSSRPGNPAEEPRRSSRRSSFAPRQPPPPGTPQPAQTRRPNRAEPFLPTVDEQPAQPQPPPPQRPQQPPASKQPAPQLPAFELPGRAAQAAPSAQPSSDERLAKLLGGFKGSVTMSQMAALCADQRAVDLLAKLAPAAEPPATITPVTYAAALTAVPSSTAPLIRTTATGSVLVLHSAANPAPAASTDAAQPPLPPAVVIKDVGAMPFVYGRVLQGHPPYTLGRVKLHLDTGAGMSCVSQELVDKIMPQLAAKGAARVRLVHPVAIHVVGKEISYAHEMVVGAQFLMGKALLRVDMLIVPHMPVSILMGMDCIPLHNMCFDWGTNKLWMYLHPDITAPGTVLKRDAQGREVRQLCQQLYTTYTKLHLPYVKP